MNTLQYVFPYLNVYDILSMELSSKHLKNMINKLNIWENRCDMLNIKNYLNAKDAIIMNVLYNNGIFKNGLWNLLIMLIGIEKFFESRYIINKSIENNDIDKLFPKIKYIFCDPDIIQYFNKIKSIKSSAPTNYKNHILTSILIGSGDHKKFIYESLIFLPIYKIKIRFCYMYTINVYDKNDNIMINEVYDARYLNKIFNMLQKFLYNDDFVILNYIYMTGLSKTIDSLNHGGCCIL